ETANDLSAFTRDAAAALASERSGDSARAERAVRPRLEAEASGRAKLASPTREDGQPVRLLGRLAAAGVEPSTAGARPEWMRVKARFGDGFLDVKRLVRDLDLHTVCESAGCPNIFECWADRTATFMILGDRCTRACGFCLVDTRKPLPVDPGEPERVARAVKTMGLEHAVITCVARDDLPDGGAAIFAE